MDSTTARDVRWANRKDLFRFNGCFRVGVGSVALSLDMALRGVPLFLIRLVMEAWDPIEDCEFCLESSDR